MNTLFTKFGAALLPALGILLGALQLAVRDNVIDETEGGQLLALVAGLVVTYLVPLVQKGPAGLLKTGAAILAAVATLIIPLFTGGATWESIIVFALAVVNAVLTEIGVQARKDVPLEAVLEGDVATITAVGWPGTGTFYTEAGEPTDEIAEVVKRGDI